MKRKTLAKWLGNVAWVGVGLWLVTGGLGLIREATGHEGGGEVPVWAGRSGDREVVGMRWATEDDYKFDRYVSGGILLVIGSIALWGSWRSYSGNPLTE